MSIQAMAWAFDQKIKPVPKLVLLALADFCDDDGTCFQAVSQIAERTCLADSTVRTHLRDLEETGEVEAVPRFDERGRQLPNVYRLLYTGRRHSDGGHREPVPGGVYHSYPPGAGAPLEDIPKRDSSSPSEKKKKEESKTPLTPRDPAAGFDLPFSSLRFREMFRLWVEHLAEKRKPLRPQSAAWRVQRQRMLAMGEERSVAAIEHSAANNYQGLYEPRSNGNSSRPQGGAGWAGGEQKWNEDELRRMGELPEGDGIAH